MVWPHKATPVKLHAIVLEERDFVALSIDRKWQRQAGLGRSQWQVRLDEDRLLQVRRSCVAFDDIAELSGSDHERSSPVEPLTGPEEAIAHPQSLKLLSEDRLEGRTNGGLRSMCFSEASHE